MERERIAEHEKTKRHNTIKESRDDEHTLKSIRNPSPDEIERRKNEDHDKRLYGWNG